MTRAFVDLAEELDAGASPVGEGWRLALSEQPDLPLYYRDGRHPSYKLKVSPSALLAIPATRVIEGLSMAR